MNAALVMARFMILYVPHIYKLGKNLQRIPYTGAFSLESEYLFSTKHGGFANDCTLKRIQMHRHQILVNHM